MKTLKYIRHKIAHWFGWNTGHVISGQIDEDRFYIAFKCEICGKISGRVEIKYDE